MADNTIELVVKAIDQASAQINGIGENVSKLGSAFKALEPILASVGGALSLNAFIDNIEHSQAAAAQLNAAFAATGAQARLTKGQLDAMTASFAANTVASKETVQEAEAVLLTFTRVRGDGFERTIEAASDLSARFGIDLVTSTRLLGRALQEPLTGMNSLQRMGVTLGDSQKYLIKQFVDSGNAAGAQDVILRNITDRFAGAAAAAHDTLGGALGDLKKAFSDLFALDTHQTGGLIDSIKELRDTVADPQFKSNLQGILSFFTNDLAAGLERINLASEVFSNVKKTFVVAFGSPTTLSPGSSGPGDHGIPIAPENVGKDDEDILNAAKAATANLKLAGEALNTGLKIALANFQVNSQWLDDFKKQIDEANAATQTGTEGIEAKYKKMYDQLGVLAKLGVDEETLSARDLTLRIQEAADLQAEALKSLGPKAVESAEEVSRAFDNISVELGKTTKALLSPEMTDQQKKAIRDIQGVFAELFNNLDEGVSGFLRSFLAAIKRIVAEILAAKVTEQLFGATTKAADGSSSSTSGILSGVLGAFLGRASGGDASGLVRVGETGPETIALPQGSHVYNAQQMKYNGMGGGGGDITFAPQYAIAITASDAGQTKAELMGYVDYRSKQDRADLYRTLSRNGFGTMR